MTRLSSHTYEVPQKGSESGPDYVLAAFPSNAGTTRDHLAEKDFLGRMAEELELLSLEQRELKKWILDGCQVKKKALSLPSRRAVGFSRAGPGPPCCPALHGHGLWGTDLNE